MGVNKLLMEVITIEKPRLYGILNHYFSNKIQGIFLHAISYLKIFQGRLNL